MGYSAIIRKVYSDEVENYGKHKYEPVNNLYNLFLYETITKGSMPKYSIKGSNRDSVLSKADELMEKYALNRIDKGTITITSNDISMYDPPIVTNLETGEMIIDE